MTSIAEALAGAGLPPLDRAAWVDVDLDVLTSNAAALASTAAPALLGAVVKADGYGHGLEAAARSAVRGGASWLCVAALGEAERLRADGYRGRVFVLYPIPPDRLARAARLEIDIPVGSLGYARLLSESASPRDPRLRVHVEVDTGMTRGGVPPAVAGQVVEVLAGSVDVVGIWTHLAAPEDPEMNTRQMRRYDEALDRARGILTVAPIRHVAASGGLAAPDVDVLDLARVGLMLYGYGPMPDGGGAEEVDPALSVHAHPVRVEQVPAGTSVGYGGDWTASGPADIATLPLGYADGWSRSTSPGGEVVVAGERVPIVGRISSDATTVDVTGVEEVGTDTEALFLGGQGDAQVTADDVAGVRRTISWEVLQQLGARLPRIYRERGRVVALRRSHEVALVTDREWLTGSYG